MSKPTTKPKFPVYKVEITTETDHGIEDAIRALQILTQDKFIWKLDGTHHEGETFTLKIKRTR